ncbi:hypothetical protein HYU11_06130 [Candidatus Woesearchaeota archaeon]|nr:hypothetical protein [Candidatus Woesearchaeota archaeon]
MHYLADVFHAERALAIYYPAGLLEMLSAERGVVVGLAGIAGLASDDDFFQVTFEVASRTHVFGDYTVAVEGGKLAMASYVAREKPAFNYKGMASF